MAYVPDYDLTTLGARAFEQLTVALAHAELGPGLNTFGDGRDGGREATFEGSIHWSKTAVAEMDPATWTGRTIFQAKYQVKPKPTPIDNAAWLQAQIGDEIGKWVESKRKRNRAEYPDYLVFVTNIDLSPVAKTGGIDLLHEYIKRRIGPDSDAAMAGLAIKDYRIWHADQMRTMIDCHQDVRWAFNGLLSVGDVLSLLAGGADPQLGRMDFDDPLREELLRSLESDQWIRLGQAGGRGDEKLRLHEVVIDPPARHEGSSDDRRTLQSILDLGDRNLRQRQADPERQPSLVIVGGPGQGKSTISQAVAQAYRSALLRETDLAPVPRGIVNDMTAALDRNGLRIPRNRRWPIRVDLAKFAEELHAVENLTLLRWIAGDISRRIESDITPAQLRSWLRMWPWALILDGLDEVSSADARRKLRAQIDALRVTADDIDADLLVVVTTRPTGYDERFAAQTFDHLQLIELPSKDAESFAKRIVDVRFPGDPDMRDKVVTRMTEASQDPSTRRLMRTPLQVTIMSLIVEKHPNLPPDRFTLFDLYYTTILDREIAKEIPVARFMAQNRAQIHKLHETVGLRLQVIAEDAEGAEAVLPLRELRELVVDQLRARGFDDEDAESTAADLEDAALKRLVLLVPRDEGIGFEVRTLQEMMAARALTSGEDDVVLRRLRATAHHPHWRNTWLLAAGRLVAQSDRFEAKLISLLRGLDTEPSRLAAMFATAPELAAEILDDNLAFQRPRFGQALVQIFLLQLDRPASSGFVSSAAAMLRLLDSEHREAVLGRLDAAVRGSRSERAVAVLLVERMLEARTSHDGALRGCVQGANLSGDERLVVDAWRQVVLLGDRDAAERRGLGELLMQYFELVDSRFQLDEPELAAATEDLDDGLIEVREGPDGRLVLPVGVAVGMDPERFVRAVEDDGVATFVEAGLRVIPDSEWPLVSMLGDLVNPSIIRRPVGSGVWLDVRRVNAEEAAY